MDSALKQTAIVSEVTQGTTPASPAFLIARDVRTTGSPQANDQRSPERRGDRMVANMYTGLRSFPKQIELPWVRDAAMDVLWQSLFCNTFSTNILKNASTLQAFTIEEKYENGATDPYKRYQGCVCDSATISLRNGEPGSVSFSVKALSETTATTALASSTYAQPTPYNDPSTPVDIVVNSLLGVSTPKVMSMNMRIQNNMREQYKWGSKDPFGIGLGLFDVTGEFQIYFSAVTDYNAFSSRLVGSSFSLTIGSVTNFKDTLQVMNCDAWNPDVDDPGQSGDHMVTINFMGRFYATDSAAVKLTRLVA